MQYLFALHAGLGGSGTINLLITNLGFGEPVWTVQEGHRKPQLIAGSQPERMPFYFHPSNTSAQRIGTKTIWAWPFPEVCTVAEHLNISGNSEVKMGTAPDAWNSIMGAMVAIVPRTWWRSEAFSGALAKFSQPLVWVTDRSVIPCVVFMHISTDIYVWQNETNMHTAKKSHAVVAGVQQRKIVCMHKRYMVLALLASCSSSLSMMTNTSVAVQIRR